VQCSRNASNAADHAAGSLIREARGALAIDCGPFWKTSARPREARKIPIRRRLRARLDKRNPPPRGYRLDIQASVDLEGLKKLQAMLWKYQGILEMMLPDKMKEAAN
jgi:hypothetical protein